MNSNDRHRDKTVRENVVNSEPTTRTLLVRLLVLFAGIGLTISTLPGIVTLSATASTSNLADKEQLSIQLNAW